ncbi:DUF1737 domain-containing protein [Eikenella sp. S3360]|uniref:DUF1737 domain-containing protein n=1 Tax=Eikenella glucosivorans TaxID=2766967 RepID=A0ABS0N897_9NEIS|nr:DUF1737 domain-containing protein [Eikenella glucosivorans]MBH5328533.1 DUF1737 domain-containing protein [Eikenella glucosivorans]
MKVYRMLTGPDDSVFCRRVTEALQQGWELHGGPTMTHTDNGVRVGQAIVKEVEHYDPAKPLSEY